MKLEITQIGGVTLMKDKRGDVKCAFDKERNCNPTCAACEIRGQKINCIRNGVDNDFEIGYTD